MLYILFGFTKPLNDFLIDEDLSLVNQNNYVFWDDFHLTTKTHSLVADTVATTLKNAYGINSPVYRLWNPDLTNHFYTTNQEEALNAVANLSYPLRE